MESKEKYNKEVHSYCHNKALSVGREADEQECRILIKQMMILACNWQRERNEKAFVDYGKRINDLELQRNEWMQKHDIEVTNRNVFEEIAYDSGKNDTLLSVNTNINSTYLEIRDLKIENKKQREVIKALVDDLISGKSCHEDIWNEAKKIAGR